MDPSTKPNDEAQKKAIFHMLSSLQVKRADHQPERLKQTTPEVFTLSRECKYKVSEMLYDKYMKNDKLCDLTIICEDNKSLRVHSCVMNSISWFKSYFQKQSANQAALSPVDLSHLPYEGLEIVVDYAYSGILLVEAKTVRSLMKVTQELRLDNLMKLIMDRLLHMTPHLKNIQFILSLCDEFHIEGHSAVEQLRQGFKDLIGEFMDKRRLRKVDKETVEKYLTDETYSHVSPAKMAAFVVDWTRYDLERREQHFPELFKQIKLQEIAISDLEKLSKISLVKECAEVAETVKTLRQTKQEKKEDREEIVTETIVVAGCLTYAFAEPGYGDNQTFNVWAYIISSNKWIPLTCLPDGILRPSLVIDNQNSLSVIALGSCDKSFFTLHRYSVLEETWSKLDLFFPDNFRGKQVKQVVRFKGKLFVVVSAVLLTPRNSLYTDENSNTELKAYVFEVGTKLSCPVEVHAATKLTKVKIWKLKNKLLLFLKTEEEKVAYQFDPLTHSIDMMRLNPEMIARAFLGEPCTLGDALMQYQLGSMAVEWSLGKKTIIAGKIKRNLPIPTSRERKELAVTGYRGDIFIFTMCDQEATERALPAGSDQEGGKASQDKCDKEKEKPRRECYRFNRDRWQWEQLADMPQELQRVVATSGRLLLRPARCPPHCPHCRTPPSWCQRVLRSEKQKRLPKNSVSKPEEWIVGLPCNSAEPETTETTFF